MLRACVLAAALLAVSAALAASSPLMQPIDELGIEEIPISSDVPLPGWTGSVYKRSYMSSDVAVCNDGTPIAYFTRPAQDGSTTNFMIFLMGGGYCSTEEVCRTRDKRLTSSDTWKETFELPGIMSDKVSANVNRVYVTYCTSDLYAGDASSEHVGWSFPFQFRGSHVVPELVRTLMDHPAPGMPSLGDAHMVHWTGCSAGGVGSLINFERLRNLLPSHIGLRHFSDAGWFIDTPDVPPGHTSIADLLKQAAPVLRFLDAENVVSPSCMASTPRERQHLCLLGMYMYPSLPYKDDMMVLKAATDAWTVYHVYGIDPRKELSPDQRKTLYHLALATEATLEPVMHVWSPNCLIHCWSMSDKLIHDVKVGGLSLVEAVLQFERDPSDKTRHVDPVPAAMSNPTCPRHLSLQATPAGES